MTRLLAALLVTVVRLALVWVRSVVAAVVVVVVGGGGVVVAAAIVVAVAVVRAIGGVSVDSGNGGVVGVVRTVVVV